MELLLSLVSGGVTGLVGTMVTSVLKFFADRENNKHELAVMDMELKHMDKEASIARDIKELDMEGKESEAAWRGLQASYAEAGKRWSTGKSVAIVAVDVVRGLMRPALTAGLVILVGVIYFHESEGETRQRVIATVLYLATSAVIWWFGSRSIMKRLPTQK